MIILLGFFALIVPGIILIVQYALLDPIVVLEGRSGPEARSRSKELTKGKRWQIFFAGFLFYGTFLPLAIGLYAILGEMELITNVATAVALDCIVSVLSSVIVILMFLFYWEGILREEAEAARAEIGGKSILVAMVDARRSSLRAEADRVRARDKVLSDPVVVATAAPGTRDGHPTATLGAIQARIFSTTSPCTSVRR